VGAVCASIFGTGLLLEEDDDPPAWDGIPLDPSEIPFFDRWAVNPYSEALDDAGTVLQLAAMAAPAVLAASDSDQWLTVGVMYVQSALVAGGLKNTLKGLADRNRPYMYTDEPSLEGIADGDRLNSFPSGHAAYAFNGAVFTSVVFSEYFPDSPWKTPVIAGSMSLAVATAVLRIESGNHFASDVLAGAVIGGLTGWLVPRLHRRDSPGEGLSITPLPSGGMVTIRF
jgi:undecaprenyl-diphosphatase